MEIRKEKQRASYRQSDERLKRDIVKILRTLVNKRNAAKPAVT